MRDHTKHIQVDKDTAIELVLNACKFSRKSEEVNIADSVDRVLAQDAVSRWDMPAKLTCRMDSVALRWEDFEGGMPDTSDWTRGVEWEFANTGISMPDGFDTAIVIENAEVSDDDSKLKILRPPSEKFAGTSPAGSRIRRGELIAAKDTLVTPDVASAIASGGNATAVVYKKPVVVFIPTGNELIGPGEDPSSGSNFETNSILIASKIRQWGGEPVVHDIVKDDKDAITQAVCEACEMGDIVVINAGSSKGSDDWNVEMLESMGKVLYHQTSHGPGHHSSAAVVDGTPVIGISGPPRGAGFTSDYYLYPAVMSYLNQPCRLKRVKVRLASDAPAKHSKTDTAEKKLPGETRPSQSQGGGSFYTITMLKVYQADDGVLEAQPFQGMADATDHPGINAYYAMPSGAGTTPPKAGQFIDVELKPGVAGRIM